MGDVVYFKSGKELRGVQVIRQTASQLTLQVMESVEPLVLPMEHIDRIERDGLEPGRRTSRERAENATPTAPNSVDAERLSPELIQLLETPISDGPLEFDGVDVVEALSGIAARLALPLMVSEEVRALPLEQRRWTATIPEGTTIITLRTDHLSRAFPQLLMRFEFNQVLVALKNAEPVEAPTPPSVPEAVVTPERVKNTTGGASTGDAPPAL